MSIKVPDPFIVLIWSAGLLLAGLQHIALGTLCRLLIHLVENTRASAQSLDKIRTSWIRAEPVSSHCSGPEPSPGAFYPLMTTLPFLAPTRIGACPVGLETVRVIGRDPRLRV